MIYKLPHFLNRPGQQQAINYILNNDKSRVILNMNWCVLFISPNDNQTLFISWHQTKGKARRKASKLLNNLDNGDDNRYFIILKKEGQVSR